MAGSRHPGPRANELEAGLDQNVVASSRATRPDVVGVVLASGRGVRMGGPKALLAWECPAPSCLAHAHVLGRRAECGRVVVVTRHDIGESLQALAAFDLVISSEPDSDGPAGSLAAACAAGIFQGSELALITPVDVPPARSGTVLRLLDALTPTTKAARPRFGARRGHPVAIRTHTLLEAYARSRPPLRDVLRSLGEACADVPVDDADVVADLDTPEAYLARAGHPPRFV